MISRQDRIQALADSVGVGLDGTTQFEGLWLLGTSDDRVPVIVSPQGRVIQGPADLLLHPLREAAKIVFEKGGSVVRVDPFLTQEEVTFVQEEAVRLGLQKDWDTDMTARQIVDNAWRAGIDIQFKQHLVEAWVAQEIA
jgi:hypothetical protein